MTRPSNLIYCRWVRFSPLTDRVVGGGGGGHEGRFNRDLLPVLSAGGPCEQFWHGQGCHLFDVVYPAFPPPTTTSPTLQGALKDDFRETVVPCDMPESCKFPSLDSCQKRFLWTHKDVDLPPHPVVGKQAGCMFHSRRGGWRWQQTCRSWTCLRSR